MTNAFNSPKPLQPFDIGCLAANLAFYRIFTKSPSVFTSASGASGIISSLISGFLALSLVMVVILLSSKFQNPKKQRGYSSFLSGVIGLFVSIAVLVYLGISYAINVYDFSSLAKLIAFPKSPLWFVAAFFIIGSLCGAFGNLNSILRLHGVLVPLCSFGILVLCLFTLPTGSILNISPLFGNGFSQIAECSFYGCVIYSDIILLFFICPNDKNRSKYHKAIIWGTLAAIVINTLFTAAYCFAVSEHTAYNGHFPIYLLLKEIRIGRFIQRVDAIVQLFSAFSGLLQLSFTVTLLSTILRRVLFIPVKNGGLPDEKA